MEVHTNLAKAQEDGAMWGEGAQSSEKRRRKSLPTVGSEGAGVAARRDENSEPEY